MSWQAIAYKDVHDASRSYTLWALIGFFTVLFLGFTGIHMYFGEETFVAFLDGFAGLIGLLLPLIGLLLGYKSISEPRSSGSLLLILSNPHSRWDLSVGTMVGRSLVLVVPTGIGLLLAGGLGVALYGTDGLFAFPGFVIATLLYGLAFVGFAVGLSLFTAADRWITLGAFGGYLLLVMFWDNFHTLTLLILHRFDVEVLQSMPDWALLFRLIKPSESYYRLLQATFDTPRAARYVVGDVPLYVDWWMAALILVGWTVLPVLIGYHRFRDADL